ncbi:Hypothetical_protein [Hexamita inflata]|uniref:Hypothetical_protein n=1 Tax=Hexamita inflata TaxID=28002 RepID=A0AA86RGW9_9EUKA|nr:Hypothetical protein HINF_LOCUS62173 [Hexamita inflata]
MYSWYMKRQNDFWKQSELCWFLLWNRLVDSNLKFSVVIVLQVFVEQNAELAVVSDTGFIICCKAVENLVWNWIEVLDWVRGLFSNRLQKVLLYQEVADSEQEEVMFSRVSCITTS